VHDLAKASRYCELYNQHFSDRHFEVVEVVADGEINPTVDGRFLGFDISSGHNASMLWWGLTTPPDLGSKVPKEIAILVDLTNRLFAPRLNRDGLFGSFEDASLCRAAKIALQSFCPGLFEGGSLEPFEIVGVYLTSPPR